MVLLKFCFCRSFLFLAELSLNLGIFLIHSLGVITLGMASVAYTKHRRDWRTNKKTKWHFQNVLYRDSIAVQSRAYYFFERVPAEEGKSMFPGTATVKRGGRKRPCPCHESRLVQPVLLSLRKCWDLAALAASDLFLSGYALSCP